MAISRPEYILQLVENNKALGYNNNQNYFKNASVVNRLTELAYTMNSVSRKLLKYDLQCWQIEETSQKEKTLFGCG